MWSVVDIFTGQPLVIEGITMDCILPEEADELVDLMNFRDMKARGVLRPNP